jgi:2-methylcitrate dehydratase PrpD
MKGATMDMNITERLAEFAATTTTADLGEGAAVQARNLLLDSVACAIASDFGNETESYAGFAEAAGGRGDSTVIGSGAGLSPLGATLLNAYQITAATVCDTYVPAHVHITPEIVPPALAIAERDGLDGAALLTAIALGSEVAVRLATGINYAVAGPRGWHMPGIVGPFGAAAAVGHLTGLTPLQMRNAFGLAGSQSAGTWASWGTPTVKFHQSRGAGSGLLAALLAKTGFTSSPDIIGHPDGGILAAYSDGGRPEKVLENIGRHWEFEEIALRVWPGGTPLQPTLTAAFDLIGAHSPDPDAIARVLIEVSQDVYDAHARFDQPKGTFEALLSFHLAVACALRDRRFWLTSVEPDALDDPGLRAFVAERVVMAVDPALTRESSRVTLEMTDGARLESRVDAAKGTRKNPVTLDDLRKKFMHCAAGRLSDAEANELLEIMVQIDKVSDLGRFFELLRSPKRRTG